MPGTFAEQAREYARKAVLGEDNWQDPTYEGSDHYRELVERMTEAWMDGYNTGLEDAFPRPKRERIPPFKYP